MVSDAIPVEDTPVEDTPVEEFETKRILLISGGHFVHDTFSAFIAPLLPLLIDKLGLSLGSS